MASPISFTIELSPVLDDGSCDGIDFGGHACCSSCLVVLELGGQSEADTSLSAPEAASMMASISASVIGVDNAINPLPAASTPRLRQGAAENRLAFGLLHRSDRLIDSRGLGDRRNES